MSLRATLASLLLAFWLQASSSTVAAQESPATPRPPLADPLQLQAEVRLEALDLASEEIRFVPLDGGCSIVLQVQQRYVRRKKERWRNIAAMKTRSGFTYLQSEVGYYRLGKYLNFNIFAVTVFQELTRPALEKLVAELEDRSYGAECKEKSRTKLVAELKLLLTEKEPTLAVILKEWLPLFKNFPSDGFHRLPEVFAFREHLTVAGKQPPDTVVEFTTRPRSKKSRRYAAQASIKAMAKDISNLMVLDAVASQYDRWGGHNIHFRLGHGEEFVRADDGLWRGGMARILALDNGSAMRSETTRAFEHLKEHVHRYDRQFVARLEALQQWVNQAPREARKWLGLPRFEFRNLRRNLKTVLDYIEADTKDHPERWFVEN